MKAYTYWEGLRTPYINRCFGIMQHYGVEIITPHTTEDYGVTHPMLDVPAHNADYIRAHLLAECGGVWMDADTILFTNPIEAMQRYIDAFGFVGFGWAVGQPCVGFFGCKPGCEIVRGWAAEQDKFIDGKKERGWASLGAYSLWPQLIGRQYGHIDMYRIAPFPWVDAWKFGGLYDIRDFRRSNAICWQLYNREIGKASGEWLANPSTLLSQAFDYAEGLIC